MDLVCSSMHQFPYCIEVVVRMDHVDRTKSPPPPDPRQILRLGARPGERVSKQTGIAGLSAVLIAQERMLLQEIAELDAK
jgi:hypothetical protein